MQSVSLSWCPITCGKLFVLVGVNMHQNTQYSVCVCVCKWIWLMGALGNIVTFIRSPLVVHLTPHLVWPSPPQTPASHPRLHLINPRCHHCHTSGYCQSKPWHQDVKMMNGLFRTGSGDGFGRHPTLTRLLYPFFTFFPLPRLCLSPVRPWVNRNQVIIFHKYTPPKYGLYSFSFGQSSPHDGSELPSSSVFTPLRLVVNNFEVNRCSNDPSGAPNLLASSPVDKDVLS